MIIGMIICFLVILGAWWLARLFQRKEKENEKEDIAI